MLPCTVEKVQRGCSNLLIPRTNGVVTLSEQVKLTNNLSEALKSDIIAVSISAQSLRSLMKEISGYDISGKTFVLCMKGIEVPTGKRLTEVVGEFVDSSCKIAVWIGPGHVQEFVRGIPNCMVIDSDDQSLKERLVTAFSGNLIRFYIGNDLIGNEIGAAAKNVIGIAAGMLDGLDLSSLKGALMSRAAREIARLIEAMGGNVLSAYGLCHLGDYEATVFSKYSHNRRYGEAFVKGEPFGELAEGYATAQAMMILSERYNVELPICQAVYDVLYNGKDVNEAISELFLRSIKQEF
ncbi:MAG: NAD(P)H-dependent glycerol-3-phosphate dehydrogenase [Eubacteriales bacterium]